MYMHAVYTHNGLDLELLLVRCRSELTELKLGPLTHAL